MQENVDKTDERPETLRLTCDTMLGKLSRGLRLMGIDTEYRRGIGGMRGYKQARAKGRLFLTRAGRLKELPDVVYVESNDPAEQLVQVRARFGLAEGPEPAPAAPVAERKAKAAAEPDRNRCGECNVELERISREQARPTIPFFIYQIHHEFSRCPKCRRVYWPGSHVRDETPPPAGRPGPRRGQTAGRRSASRPRRGRGGSNRSGA